MIFEGSLPYLGLNDMKSESNEQAFNTNSNNKKGTFKYTHEIDFIESALVKIPEFCLYLLFFANFLVSFRSFSLALAVAGIRTI